MAGLRMHLTEQLGFRGIRAARDHSATGSNVPNAEAFRAIANRPTDCDTKALEAL
jgi:hypothetical protein